ncbi:MAG: hypothetical protein GY835_11130 [bacterium]|nr:hypothetical protein [bacterium]
MSEEKKQVLDMLAEGKITAEEAERLLERLEPFGGRKHRHEDRPHKGKRFRFQKDFHLDTNPKENEPQPTSCGALKFLRVLVNSNDGDTVNIRVPLALIKTGISLSTMLPSDANEKLEANGIDLSSLSKMKGDELVEALRELQVNVDANDGSTVRIFCE